MDRFLLVCLGSALGGGARYLIGQAAVQLLGPAFPYGTLVVNVIGSFSIGLIMHVGMTSTLISPTTRIFLTTGVMGGLTTYSTFNYETLSFIQDGAWQLAALNLVGTVVVCLLAGILGLAAGELWVGG